MSTGLSAGTPEPGSDRRADIQGLRALAVVLVVAFHAGLDVPGGFVGVDIFFVISGFVITSLITRELDGTGQFSFASFYARRVRRILPALALTVVVVAIASLGAVSPSEQPIAARTGAAASVSLANVLLYRSPNGYFDAAPTLNPLLHTWSLSVEEQFYLVFPAILTVAFMLGRRRQRGRAVVAWSIGAVAVGSFLLGVMTTFRSVNIAGLDLNSQFAFYMAPARAWEFAAGALLCLAVPWLRRAGTGFATPAAVAGTVLVGIAAFGFDDATPFPGTAALIPVAGTALLIAAGTVGANPISKVAGTRAWTRIGDISYSWYLWHWPLIVFAAAIWPTWGGARLAGGIVSLPIASVAWRFLEEPIRKDRAVRGRRALLLATVCVVVPVLASAGLYFAPTPPESAATKRFLAETGIHHADKTRRCNRGRSVDRQRPQCTWTVPGATGRVVLLGDSNAGHLTETVAGAARGLGADFTVATLPTCPPVDLVVVGRQTCRSFIARSVNELVADRPLAVVLAASTPIYLDSSDVQFRDPENGQVATSPAEKAAVWERALTRTTRTLTDAHIPVVIVHTVPQWRTWDSRECAAVRVYLAPDSCGTTQTRAQVAAFRRLALRTERDAVAGLPLVRTIDFAPDLCAAGRCTTNRGDVWLYRDGRHLSVNGARTLVGRLTTVLRTAIEGAAR